MKIGAIHPSGLTPNQIAQVIRVIREEMRGCKHAFPWETVKVEADFFGLQKHVYLAIFEGERLRALTILEHWGGERLAINNQWGDIERWKEAMTEKIVEIAKKLKCKEIAFFSVHRKEALEKVIGHMGYEVREQLCYVVKPVGD